MINKVYIVIENYSSESSGNIDIQSIYVFKNYDKAKEQFEKIKRSIKHLELGYSEIEESKDYYCEYENGEYLYYHELVYIKEEEVLDYE